MGFLLIENGNYEPIISNFLHPFGSILANNELSTTNFKIKTEERSKEMKKLLFILVIMLAGAGARSRSRPSRRKQKASTRGSAGMMRWPR